MVSAHLPGPRELVRYWSRETPGRPALISAHGVVTYGELGRRIAALSARMRELGVGTGLKVALALPNSPDYVVWLAASLEAGAIVVPMDPNVSEAEAEKLVSAGEIGFLAGSAKSKAASGPAWRTVCSDPVADACLWQRSGQAALPAQSADPLVLQFTSGSTGRPKHILHSAGQVFEDYRHFSAALGLDENDRYLAVAPFYHSFGALGLYATLAQGAILWPVSRFVPASVLAAASRFRPTLLLATPPMIDMLARCHVTEPDREAFSTLRYCICSTGPLSARTEKAFRERFQIPVRVQYGSTETLSATIDLDEGFEEGRVGRAYPGVALRVFGERNQVLPAGSTGRVGIRSPAACRGYADTDHILTAIDGYVLPGDKGYLDPTGTLYVLGRDDVYNIGGYKVDRYEVETLIRTTLPVRYVAVLPFVRAGQPALRALIEADTDKVTADGVVEICRERLLAYKVPARVDIFEELPRNEHGKVSEPALIAMIDEGNGSISIGNGISNHRLS